MPVSARTDASNAYLSFSTPDPWVASVDTGVRRHHYFGGRLWGAWANLSARPTHLWRIELGADYAFADFDDGRPDLQSATLNSRLTLGFTPDFPQRHAEVESACSTVSS